MNCKVNAFLFEGLKYVQVFIQPLQFSNYNTFHIPFNKNLNYTNLVLLLLSRIIYIPTEELLDFFVEIPCASSNLVQSEHLVIEKFVCHRSRFNKMEKRMSSVSRTRLGKLRTLLSLMCCDELFL